MMNKQSGTTLVETLVAVVISTTVVFSLAALVTLATHQTKVGGQVLTLTTTLASQKLDQLSNLNWTSLAIDAGLDCVTSPCPADLANDFTGYVEYLDAAGTVVTGATATTPGVIFTRRWQIINNSASVKTITVRVDAFVVSSGGATSAAKPTTTIATYKARQ